MFRQDTKKFLLNKNLKCHIWRILQPPMKEKCYKVFTIIYKMQFGYMVKCWVLIVP